MRDFKIWKLDDLLDTDFNDPALVEDAQKRFDLGAVIEQVGTWAVTAYGLECLNQYYPIAKDRLYEGEPGHGWMFHMAGKSWVNIEDFAEGLLAARAHHDPQRKAFPRHTKRSASPSSRSTMSPTLRFKVLKRDGYRCRLCGATAEGTRLHIDHIHPVSKGGQTVEANLWTLCAECNHGKGVRPL